MNSFLRMFGKMTILPAEISVKVTQSDINDAIGPTNCPLTKAFKRLFPYLREVKVQIDRIWLSQYGKNVPWRHISLTMTPEAVKYINMFDRGQKVGPETFNFKVCSFQGA